MLCKIWEKCMDYEIVSYLICDVLTTVVDLAVYTALRNVDVEVGASQASSWLAAVLSAYVVNKLIVFHNYNVRPSYLARGVGAFAAARAFSGVVIWAPMMAMIKPGGDREFMYEPFRKFTSSVINMALNHTFSKLQVFKKE